MADTNDAPRGMGYMGHTNEQLLTLMIQLVEQMSHLGLRGDVRLRVLLPGGEIAFHGRSAALIASDADSGDVTGKAASARSDPTIVRAEDHGRGLRICVTLGGVDHILDVANAARLRDALIYALAAKG